MNTVEKVARAIHTRTESYDESEFDQVAWERTTNNKRHRATELARAAIEAMREPTDGTMYHDQGWAGIKPNGGSPTGDVPRDAIETAQRMWVEATEKAGIGGVFSSTDLIARAILDERERAAKVAESTYAKDAFHFELGTAIAAAIRAPTE